MIIPKLKVFWEVDLSPSIDAIIAKTDCPEDENLVLEKMIYIYPCLYRYVREEGKKEKKDFSPG